MKLSSTHFVLSLLLFTMQQQGAHSSPSSFEDSEEMSITTTKRATQYVGKGQKADENEYPWFSKLVIGKNFHQCGATLVAADFVITAAKCLNEVVINNAYVEVGTLCHVNSNCGQKYESFGIKKIWVESLNYDNQSNDLALIQLNKLSTIKPAKIDLFGVKSKAYSNAKFLWTLGIDQSWNRLDEVLGKYVDQKDCKDTFGDEETITNEVLCVKGISMNKGPCLGDLGSPVYDKSNDLVVGVVNNSEYDCGYPYLSTRFLGRGMFIQKTICHNSQGENLPNFCNNMPGKVVENAKLLIEVFTDQNGQKDNKFNVKVWTTKGTFRILYERDLENNKLNKFTYFLRTNRCYSFQLIDDGGDGLIGKNTKYRVIYNSEVIADSNFVDKSYVGWVTFGDCPW